MMRALCATLLLLAALLRPGDAAAAPDAYAFSFTAIEGEPLPLSRFKGHPLLVVNTASRCGYTYQYAGLVRLWEAYRERGLVVLGVPSNDFGQELGSGAAVKEFCESSFDVDFPLTEMAHVRGSQSHPLFGWLRATLGPGVGPSWNFTKFLIGPDGHALRAWPSGTEPDGPEIRAAVEALLPGS